MCLAQEGRPQRDVCAAAAAVGQAWPEMSEEEKAPFVQQSQKPKKAWAEHHKSHGQTRTKVRGKPGSRALGCHGVTWVDRRCIGKAVRWVYSLCKACILLAGMAARLGCTSLAAAPLLGNILPAATRLAGRLCQGLGGHVEFGPHSALSLMEY